MIKYRSNTIEPLDVMRSLSAFAVFITIASLLCSYLSIPTYSPAPDVASEKKIFPSLEDPERIVIPQYPVFEAIVKLLALVSPSVVVPINNLPLLSNCAR